MNRKMLLLLVFFLSVYLPIYSQLRYPVVGVYNGNSAQGMAIWNDEAFLFNDGGQCRVLDLKSGNIHREFMAGTIVKLSK